jgi:flagellar protein FlaG
MVDMTTEHINFAGGKATATAPAKSKLSHVASDSEKFSAPGKAKVSAPKPSEINFDPIKAQQNIQQAISLLNQQMISTKRGLGFSYDDSKNTPVIRVTDASSGELVRQIPSEEVLKFAHHIDALKGMLYNKIA